MCCSAFRAISLTIRCMMKSRSVGHSCPWNHWNNWIMSDPWPPARCECTSDSRNRKILKTIHIPSPLDYNNVMACRRSHFDATGILSDIPIARTDHSPTSDMEYNWRSASLGCQPWVNFVLPLARVFWSFGSSCKRSEFWGNTTPTRICREKHLN